MQFVENKGQWGKDIRFRGDLPAGSFALQQTGYRVLLHNRKDLDQLGFYLHHGFGGSEAVKQTNSSSASSQKLPANGDQGDAPPGVLRSHVYEVKFLNANTNAVAVPDKPLPSYNNYFIGSDSSQWASNCRIYQGITYRNVYPGIDVRYYTAAGILKYDFIVNPGADLGNIAMYFDGADGLKITKGDLHIKTSVDEVVEKAPYTYQIVNDKRVELPCHFELKGNIVRFKIDAPYSKDAITVIDPSLIFSTFTGSSLDNWGYTATYDGKGNFYSGGIVLLSGSGSFPVSNGAFQTSHGGGNSGTGEPQGYDIGIMKFDPTGSNRVYATYIGGSGNEQPHSMVVDGAGNLVIAGRTTSANYPLKGALQTYGPGGSQDIVITKLNASGSALIGSVRIGGNGDDGVNIRAKYQSPRGAESIDRNYGDDARSEVILDGAGNIYVASCTQSTNFPITASSPQAKAGAANAAKRVQDAVVMKFTPDLGGVLFSDLIGGSDDDAAFVLAINPSDGHLFVGGVTASNDFPGPKTGVKYPTFQGGICDGFVAEFTNTGVLIRDGYFGTSGNDLIYGIQFDRFGFPYIAGTTTGSWPILNAAFSQTGGKQFISKLKPDLSDYVYSTVFGTASANPNLSLTAFLVDRCENVYVSGWGGSTDVQDGFPNSYTNGLPLTPDAFQKRTDGSDFYFFVLEKNAASQLYGSYFGQFGGFGEHVDGGTSRFDANGVIYQAICANCSTKPTNPADFFPTTPGAWSQTNNSTDCNLAAVKIAFNLAGVGAGLQASINGVPHDTSGCVPMVVDFTDTLAQGKKYIWDFNDGSPKVTTTTPSISHTFNTIGLYRVSLVSIDSSTCNVADTARVTMRVRDDQATLAFTTTKLPPCASLTYQFTNKSTSVKPFTANSFRWDFGDGTTQLAGSGSVNHTYSAAGSYDVKLVLIDTNYCNEPDSLVKKVRLSPTVKAQFEASPSGCVPYNAVFTNNSLGGTDFLWEFGDGSTSTLPDPTHLYANTGSYKVRLIATDTNTCNRVDTSAYFTIVVSPYPKSAFTYMPQPTETNKPVSFLNGATGGAKYKWLFGDGDTLMTILPDTVVQHLYNATGTYNTCLVTYNSFGCIDTSCQTVSVVILNSVDVPNAFSPNGDGRNDKIYVHGYGITRMTWNIYNRWGTLVYQGTDPNAGWDGTYKGVLQPQDVYHYTLLIEFGGKEKATKKGDITLLR
ncbi:MAG: PKD domain-containing protein [Chitinophagaceae bacterium]|nr:PKD domain-containing protein [Chitinophagaceae bacterium]